MKENISNDKIQVVLQIQTATSLRHFRADYHFELHTDKQHLSFCGGRFVQYKATSLEKQHKHELLTEPDLGVTIDLINPDTYRIDPNSKSPVVSSSHILSLKL